MDACSYYLKEIDRLSSMYVELPTYQMVFEAGGNADATISKNAKITTDSKKLFQKACDAIRTIFEKIKGTIQNIIDYVRTDGSEKTKYKAFLEKCKDDPEFAGKTITLNDYRKINEEYERTLRKAEKAYKNTKDEELEKKPTIAKAFMDDIDALLNKTKKAAKSLGKTTASMAIGLTKSFTVQAALDYAGQCREHAAQVQMMIDWDMGLLKELEKEIGCLNMAKFKTKVKLLNSKTEWIRKIAHAREMQCLGLKDSIKQTLTSIGALTSSAFQSKSVKKGALAVGKEFGTDAVKAGVHVAKVGASAYSGAKSEYKERKRWAKETSQYDDEHKAGLEERLTNHTNTQIEKAEKKAQKQAKKEQKKAARESRKNKG